MTRLLLLLGAVPAFGHEGESLAPHDLPTAWAWDPLILAGLALSAWLYWHGASEERGIRRWERRCYWGGWWALMIALVSPLHPMGEVLFAAHMVQHEVMMLIAAPLLVLGRPVAPYLWALPPGWRRRAGALSKSRILSASWGRISRPFHAWWIHAVALWAWHAPALFQATVSNDLVHTFQHLSFLISALLFWWALFRGRDAALSHGAGVFYVFSTAVHSSVLGALLTFSQRVWYPVYSESTPKWGLTPIEDQQIGGLVMWVPGGIVFVAAGLWLFARWIQEPATRRAARITSLLLVLFTAGCTPELQFENKYASAHAATGGDANKGRQVILHYGCGTCHTIPGITGATAMVGPPLTGIAVRTYIAGVLPNTPDNMVRWISDPPAVDHLTAMPKLGLSSEDARHATAYLYTLR